MSVKHSFQEKELIVELYRQGSPVKDLVSRFHVTDHCVRILVGRYERFGLDGLQERHPRYIPDKIKIKVVEEYKKHLLSLPQICVKYDVSYTAANHWIHLYKTGGTELLTQRKFRLSIAMGSLKKRTKDATYEELLERVEYLEAENALLKKAKALVLKKKDLTTKFGRK